MNQQLLTAFTQIKEYFKNQTKQTKIIIISVTVLVFALSIITPLVLRANADREFAILYQGLSVSEQTEILAILYDLRQDARVEDGIIRVRAADVNRLKLQLSALGYPRSALSYNVFTTNTGFMTTELERKQYLIIDLQSRLEATLRQISGVRRAIVTLNIPDDNTFIWQTNTNKSSASVLLDLDAMVRLDSGQVQAVRNLVASSVPRMDASSVVVVDASTGIEISNPNTNPLEGNFLQLQFEDMVQQRIENNVLNLLTLAYGPQNVRVSARVTLDFDKMISDEIQYIPAEDGRGILSRLEEWYILNRTNQTPGETSNNEIPIYVVGENGEGVVERKVSSEYLVSQIRRQIERSTPQLKSASISVVINDEDITETDIDNWSQVISRATEIDVENIKVLSFFRANNNQTIDVPTFDIMQYQVPILIGSGVLLIIIVISIILGRKSKLAKAKVLESLELAAKSKQSKVVTSKDTVEKLNDFLGVNPEIAANLIREMLKEED